MMFGFVKSHADDSRWLQNNTSLHTSLSDLTLLLCVSRRWVLSSAVCSRQATGENFWRIKLCCSCLSVSLLFSHLKPYKHLIQWTLGTSQTVSDAVCVSVHVLSLKCTCPVMYLSSYLPCYVFVRLCICLLVCSVMYLSSCLSSYVFVLLFVLLCICSLVGQVMYLYFHTLLFYRK